MTLFINACIRECSRTMRIANALLAKIGDDVTEINLSEANLKPLSLDLLNRRTALVSSGDYSDAMFDNAKLLTSADNIVIAAPFWDFSFPAELKVFIENIFVTGLVCSYGKDGTPHGLCKADKVYYVTTAGGPYVPDFSYRYISTLFTRCFGIKEAKLIYAEMLDVDGYDADSIVEETIKKL